MALGKCRECGREVAKSAKSCPGCGVAKPVKEISKLNILVGVVVVLVAARVCSHSGSDKSASASTSPVAPAALAVAPQPAEPAKPAEPVKLDTLKASTLLQAYSANEIAADAKYKGKRFKVTGTVVAIKSDITDDPQVWLVSDLNPVVANGIRKGFAATLNKGDTIEYGCTVSGSIVGMPTLDCSGAQ